MYFQSFAQVFPPKLSGANWIIFFEVDFQIVRFGVEQDHSQEVLEEVVDG